ncbi:MAG: hypothetical protein D6688_08945 [Alphaproteobacteria bacterium]|nr:MAG: hypothetical protein D6688_08945 [Alphaproteobacteria bacterium]
MQAASRIREDVARALEALGPQGAEGLIGDATRWLEGVATKAEGMLDEAIDATGRALAELGEAQGLVERALEGLDFDPYELERVEERLFAIRGLARKHGVLPEDLPALAEELGARLGAIETGEAALAELGARLRKAEAAYASAAARLSAARKAAAADLDAAMTAELHPLRMERAVFRTDVAPAEPGPEGTDQVTFTVATNPGAPAGPLNRIASGGELSRFLLALKVCLRRGAEDVTMIFDEIDRGVGGATADAVGRRLRALSEGGQVIVVTHSPQVAARAERHFRVEKRVEGERTLSHVAALGAAERIDEIARMLSGDVVTDAARDAARALVAG